MRSKPQDAGGGGCVGERLTGTQFNPSHQNRPSGDKRGSDESGGCCCIALREV